MSAHNVRFFDGQKPVGMQGTLTVTDAVISFDDDGSAKRYVIRMGEISECVKEKTGTVVRAVQKDPLGNLCHRMISADGHQLYDDLFPRIHKSGIKGFFKENRFWRVTGIVAALGVVFACVMWLLITQSYRIVPFDAEKKLGMQMSTSAFTFAPWYEDAREKKRIEQILKKIVPAQSPFEYSVYLLDSKDVNAFAVPGGGVIIFKGMLTSGITDNEIACVLAHEVSHVELRHGIRQLIRFAGITYIIHIAGGVGLDQVQGIETINDLASLVVLFKYSREFEEDADANAVKLARAAGYDPRGLATFLEKMDKMSGAVVPPEYLSTHPDTKKRIHRIEMLINGTK